MKDVQVYCGQKACFEHPLDKDIKFKIDAFVFTYVPEWVIKTEFWRMLEASKKAKIISSARDVSNIEMAGKVSQDSVNEAINGERKTAKAAKQIEVAKEKETDLVWAPDEDEVETEEVEEIETEVEIEAVDETEEIIPLETLSNKELYKICLQRGIKAEPKKNKEYYLGLLQ